MAKIPNRSLAAVAAVLLATVPATGMAQAKSDLPATAEASKLDLARELMVAIDARATMQRTMQAMTAAMARSFATTSGDKDFAKVLQEVGDEELAKLTREALPLTAQVYAESFDEQELRDLLAFYRSSAGRKLIEKGPELSQRSQAAIAPLIPVMQRDLIVKMFSRICVVKKCTDEEQLAMQQAEKQVLQRLDAQTRAEPTT